MASSINAYQSTVAEIMRSAEEKLGKEYTEQVNMGRYSIVREFLDALVSSGELTEMNRIRIQENPELKEFFHQTQPKDMDLDASDDSDDSDDSSDDSSEEEEEIIFEDRKTFPKKNSEKTDEFVLRYIDYHWDDLSWKRIPNDDSKHCFYNPDEKRYMVWRYSRISDPHTGQIGGVVLNQGDNPNLVICNGVVKLFKNRYSGVLIRQLDIVNKPFKDLDEILTLL